VCLDRSQKSQEKPLKLPILKVQGHSRSLTLTPLKGMSLVLVMISSMYASICKHFHATQANSRKNNHFLGGCPRAPPCLNIEGRNLQQYNLCLILKISYADYLGLSPAILSQFTTKMCVTAQNCEKKSLKQLIVGAQSHSRSSTLTFL